MYKLLSIIVNLLKRMPLAYTWLGLGLIIIMSSLGGLIGSGIAYKLSTNDDKTPAIAMMIGLFLGSILTYF